MKRLASWSWITTSYYITGPRNTDPNYLSLGRVFGAGLYKFKSRTRYVYPPLHAYSQDLFDPIHIYWEREKIPVRIRYFKFRDLVPVQLRNRIAEIWPCGISWYWNTLYCGACVQAYFSVFRVFTQNTYMYVYFIGAHMIIFMRGCICTYPT